MPEYVFTRVLPNPITGEQTDTNAELERRFTVPRSGFVQMEAKAAIVPGPKALELVDSSPGFNVSATSTFGSLPRLAPRNLVDEDGTTSWISGMLDDGITVDPNPQIVMQWNESRRLDSMVLHAAPGYALPRSVRVAGNGEVRTAQISRDGIASFAPLTTNHVVVDFVLPPPVATSAATSQDSSAMRVGLSLLEFPAAHDLLPGPLDASRVVTTDCQNGPTVEVAGVQRRFSVTATLGDVVNLRSVDAIACDGTPISLTAGTQDLSTASGNLFAITGVHLVDPALTRQPSTGASRATEVRSWADESRSVEVGSGAATYLAVNENANDGWKATLNGQVLESVVLDGWRQGYVVPAGAGGLIQLRYQPSVPYRAGLIVGLALVLLLVLGRLAPPRQRGAAPSGVEEGTWPKWVAKGVPAALALVIGGPIALVVVGLLGLRRLSSQWIGAVIVLLLVGAVAGATIPYGRDASSTWGSDGRIVSALVVTAMAVLAATLSARSTKRPSGAR
jgi:arabinofuranan 3-O-arabinosyltransferase